MKYWEIIADNLKKRGWSVGCVSAIETLWCVPLGLRHCATTDSMDFAALGFQRAQTRWRKAYPLLPHSPINAALCAAPPRQRLPVLMDARLPPGQSRRN